MNFNYSIQNSGLVAWNGSAAIPIDIRKHIGFSFTFQVMVDIANDTTFNVMAAPPSDADNCVPGTFVPVAEVLTCVAGGWVVPEPQATVVVPAGTPAGSICTAALPCKPDAFVQVVGVAGDFANVFVVATMHGPK